MHKGIIELEALTDTSILKNVIIVKEHEEHHPEAFIKTWHVYKVKISDNAIGTIIEKISKAIKKDWYSIFWNDYEVYAVFYNKVFKVSRKIAESGKYEEVKSYAVSHGIQREFIDLQKEIDSW